MIGDISLPAINDDLSYKTKVLNELSDIMNRIRKHSTNGIYDKDERPIKISDYHFNGRSIKVYWYRCVNDDPNNKEFHFEEIPFEFLHYPETVDDFINRAEEKLKNENEINKKIFNL